MPPAPLMEVRSARIRMLSAQLKPLSPAESFDVSKRILLIAQGPPVVEEEDKPRPLTVVGGVTVSGEVFFPPPSAATSSGMVDAREMEALPLGPVPPPPALPDLFISLNARAPKLTRRAKGVLG